LNKNSKNLRAFRFKANFESFTVEYYTVPDPGFNAWWVKKLCTLNGSVEPFMLYFPYFLLLVACILWFVGKDGTYSFLYLYVQLQRDIGS
jgi:hypothetical protein